MKRLLFCCFFYLTACIVYAQENPPETNSGKAYLEKVIEQLLDSSLVYYDKGNYAKSLKINIEAIEKAKEVQNPSLLSKAYRYVAYDYLIIDDTLSARNNFENSKEYAILSNNKVRLGESFMDLGNFYSSTPEDFKKADMFFDDAILIFKEANDTLSLVKSYFNVILNNIRAEDFEKVKLYLDLLEEPEYTKYLSEPYKISMGVYYVEYYLEFEKNYEKSIETALAIIAVAKESEYLNDLELLYFFISEAHYNQQNYKEAMTYRKLYDEIKTHNFEITKNAISETVSAKFQIDQYEKSLADAKEKAILQAEIASNKSTLNNVLIAMCAIGLLLLTYVFYVNIKRKKLNVALVKKNEEYQQAKEKSDHLSTVKSKFFATVSHELRTPLYGVIGISSILLEDNNLKEHKEDLKSLKFSADYLLALINELLQINKIDSNKVENQIVSFNVSELLKSITATVEYIRQQNKNSIILDIDPKTPKQILGDRVRLSQVLMNLIGNACKFTENGTITISLRPLKTFNDTVLLHFSIKDTGIGIAKDMQEYMFDEFTQIENLNYTNQGTGLGLPIVRKLLKLSNSEIRCISELGKGSEFLFDIEYTIDIHKSLTNEARKNIDESLLKGKKILIVEDNRINQIITKKILEKKGVLCTIASDGTEAIKAVKNKNFDLILMDLNMPNKNGYEASHSIREFNQSIPIIALTAVEVEEVRGKIFEAQMNDIIVKPYDTTKFIAVLLKNLAPEIKKRNSILVK